MYCYRCGNYNNEGVPHCQWCGCAINYNIKKINKKKNRKDYFIAVPVLLFMMISAWIYFLPTETVNEDIESLFLENISYEVQYEPDEGPVSTTPLRDFYTVTDGSVSNTVMVYFIGSDLESDAGFASDDIYEMLASNFGDNVNLILMTGGSTYWYMDEISNETCQYWQVKNNELILLDGSLGNINMATPQTLTDFVNFSVSNYPADRYSLIMWNHGGGTFSGFGIDEHYPESTLTLTNLSDAFAEMDVKFDFVGFDACLMATAETAIMLEPYADYLIASQELEPGLGWYYTDWITTLSLNPSISTVDLGTEIIDDYVEQCELDQQNPEATLSIIELRMMPQTYEVITDYFGHAITEIKNNEYYDISSARGNAKDFGEGDFEQIDIIDYVKRTEVEGALDVVAAVNSAVKYYNNSSDVNNAFGLAMYFPYDYPEYYTEIQEVLHDVGLSTEYTDFFNVFVSAMSGGQLQANHGVQNSYSSEDWYDPETAFIYEVDYSAGVLQELVIDEKNDGYVLRLTDEQWANINKIELQLLIDDGEGYVDLGSDNVYEFDDDGDLKIEFDYTWVALDGIVVPYFVEKEDYESDDWFTYGRVPAFLNYDEYIEIIVYWDHEYPDGYVAGYRKYSETGTPAGKGLFPLEPGDKVEWVVDYYDYEFNYDDYYMYGEPYTVPHTDIIVSYEHVGNADALIFFKLTDYFNNLYETEAVLYTD